ncbi:MAG: 3-phosphoshikimate 1-carboxyvinyltransferase, partial [Natronospirillum sp.]
MDSLTLQPLSSAHGEVTIPGSKSLSNRILLLAAMADGTTEITNLLHSDDIERMLDALRTLGVHYELNADKTRCVVTGNGGPLTAKTPAELFLGNAGTAMRPLTAALCLGQGEFVLTGVPRMYERPIGDLIDALRQLGADINCTGTEGFPPLQIRGTGLRGGTVQIKGNISSQFLTALLMSAPYSDTDLHIEVVGELVSKPYIDITLAVMQQFGVQVENLDYRHLIVRAGQRYRSPGTLMVEGDAS